MRGLFNQYLSGSTLLLFEHVYMLVESSGIDVIGIHNAFLSLSVIFHSFEGLLVYCVVIACLNCMSLRYSLSGWMMESCILLFCKVSHLSLLCLVKCSIPGRTESFWNELNYVKNMWKHRQELKVEDAGIAALFGIECFAWFCAGEIAGRGFTFTGYYPWKPTG